MITVEEMKKLFSENENKGVWIKTNPNDVVEKFWTYEKAVADIPDSLRDDLCGWEKSRIGYIPVFKTLQEEWDKAYKEFCERKQAWCNKYGCE